MDCDIESAIIEDDYDLNELCRQENFEFTRLTDTVRKHYVQYLEKQLDENLLKWEKYQQNVLNLEYYKAPIKRTVKILEDKAVKACMIGQLYQRAMIKIISCIKHLTQEKRLVKTLEGILNGTEQLIQNHNHKSVQTYTHDVFKVDEYSSKEDRHSFKVLDHNYRKNAMKKIPPKNTIEITKLEDAVQNEESMQIFYRTLPTDNVEWHTAATKRKRIEQAERICENQNFVYESASTQLESPALRPIGEENESPPSTCMVTTNEINDSDIKDDVALELARMFSEEKTELDEIFGIDPNDEPDDPQICSILKEIQNAKINIGGEHQQNPCTNTCEPKSNETDVTMKISIESPTTVTINVPHTTVKDLKLKNEFQYDEQLQRQQCHHHQHHCDSKIVDLSKSLWPCELFMQKQKLVESLSRLVDEDFRWIDIMKWKFSQLFGEDSDDEFASCSPSIELDDTLINSCIRRISPWVVKYLMKPMKEGLIGNRYLFKRLAKQLAHSIIIENQYPDESAVKSWVENVFCLHHAILSVDDLRDLPLQLSSLNY